VSENGVEDVINNEDIIKAILLR